jgi:hypothetical protein
MTPFVESTAHDLARNRTVRARIHISLVKAPQLFMHSLRVWIRRSAGGLVTYVLIKQSCELIHMIHLLCNLLG